MALLRRAQVRFTSEKKVITLSYAKEDVDAGEMVTKYQLYVLLGLAAFPNDCPERRAIIQMGNQYIEMAISVGGRFVCTNAWLGNVHQVLFVKKLVNVICKKTWEQVAQQTVEVNLWEQQAKECRARRAYAISKGVNLDSLTADEVCKSPEGLDFWATCGVSAIAGSVPKAKARAAKAKPKAIVAEGGKTLQKLEKELKDMLGTEITLTSDFAKLEVTVSGDETKFAWATTFMDEARKHKGVLTELGEGEFLAKFKAAALSPAMLKDLKKDMGDTYLTSLVSTNEKFAPAVNSFAVAISQAIYMASAVSSLSGPLMFRDAKS